MFKKEEVTEELLRRFNRSDPNFYHSVQFELEGFLPTCKFSFYSYTVGDSVYWYGFRKMKVIKSSAIFCCQGTFNENDFLQGLREFDKTVGITSSKQPFMFLGDDIFVTTATKMLETEGYEWKRYPTINYFMNEEQEKLLMDYEIPTTPEGYELGSSTPEDAEVITKTWIHAAPGDEEQTRMKVTYFPSSCVRYQGQPVAFEMVDVSGIMNHQFVLEEHRRKGLGNIVELDLAKKCIKRGIVVYKNVETFNKHVIEATEKSPFWSRVEDEKGEPVIRSYLAIWPKGTN